MEKIEIVNLVQQWGSPCYLFRSNDFCDNFMNLVNTFREIYPNYIPAYSYKTNYTPYICKLVKQIGGYAEVVSDMELSLARKIGYSPNQIIYNGPNKGVMMEDHLLNGGISNIDHMCEAKRVINLAKKNPCQTIKIGIRINTDVGAGYTSRFGIDTTSNEFKEIVTLFKETPNIRLVGLHLHISRARSLEAWERRIKNVLKVADEIFPIDTPDYIDLGSGMFADMEETLKKQFSTKVPSYKDYAEVVGGEMAKHYNNVNKKPILFTEPGTTVVSRYLSLITTVQCLKTIKGNNYAIVDSDIHNAGETCIYTKIPYTLYPQMLSQNSLNNVDIVGYTCLEQDCIYKKMPEYVSAGDIIEFRNVGGYSIVYKPPFILPNCRMVTTTIDGKLKEIKRAETFDDVFKTYFF